MRSQSLVIVAIALACAGGAGLLLHGSLASGGAAGGATISVVVAADEVPRGAALEADSLALRPFPKDMAPPGALHRIEDAAGRSTLGHLVKGEVVLDAKLAPRGTKGGIAALIPSGMRAIAIQIPNVATGVAGFILPGNRVDVLISYDDRPGQPQVAAGAQTLLENVEILAVDQRIEAPAENRVDASEMRSVTLLVTPDQAARLHVAMSKGTLHLSLRNPGDTARAPRPGRGPSAWLESLRLLGALQAGKAPGAPPARVEPPRGGPPRPAAPPPRWVRTVRSNRETVVRLDVRN